MTKVTEEFIYGFFYNKMLEAVKPLQEVKVAIDPCEEALIKRLSGIIDEILHTEF